MKKPKFSHGQHLTPTRLALALAAALTLTCPAAWGAVTVTGPYWLVPYEPLILGPGDIDLPGSWLVLGAGAPGSFSVTAGSVVKLGGLGLASAGGSASGLIDGSGTRVELHSGGDFTRLDVGHFGSAELTVSGGAIVDGRVNSAACAHGGCRNSVGSTAGSSGTLNITGAGSHVALLGSFYVAGTHADTGFGTPGADSHGTVNLSNGGWLTTDEASLGNSYLGPASLGSERSFAAVSIQGAGSRWHVTGGTANDRGAMFTLANGARSHASVSVSDAGRLDIAAVPGRDYGLRVGSGGDASLTVSGNGSRLTLAGDAERGFLHIAEGGGTGVLTVADGGALVSSARWVQVGFNGGNGRFIVSGPGSRAEFSNLASIDVGNAGKGKLELLNGAALSTGQLNLGRQAGGSGDVSVDGADSRLSLAMVAGERLYIGDGALSVSRGGVLDGRVNASACDGGVWCGALIGAHAGANASLTVTGVGSKANFLGSFQAGVAELAVQSLDGWTRGTPGGATVASVRVLDGGLIQADRFSAGLGTFSLGATGTESSLTQVLISGSGSVMRLTGGDNAAIFQTIIWNANNAVVNVAITDGGKLQLIAPAQSGAIMNLSTRPGMTDFTVSGAGSAVEFSSPDYGWLTLGSNGGTARMSFSAGAQLSGVNFLQVGIRGGQAMLSFDGAGTAGHFGSNAYLELGRRDGQGVLTISNGASVSTAANSQDATVFIGVGSSATTTSAASSGDGTLDINGVGSLLSLRTPVSVAGVPDENLYNPNVSIGHRANGNLHISAGGVLLMQGDAASTAALPRNTAISVGGVAGSGLLSVSGAGSTLKVLGQDAGIWVGSGATGTGQMQVLDGARVDTSQLQVGNYGGSGSLKIDAAEVHLNGQWSSENLGAGLSVGLGAGSSGQVHLLSGSRLMISNLGSAGAEVSLGGNRSVAGGSGLLRMLDSQLLIEAASGKAEVSVGHYSGFGMVLLDEASSINVGDGSVYLGRQAQAVGVMTLAGNSSLVAGYVGVGSAHGVDGGVGILNVNDSTLTATVLEIGHTGFVNGNGVLNANIINRGAIGPGNSPGTLTLGGDFSNQAGGRLVLEVTANGLGGFDVDRLIFADAAVVDLSGLQISFSFLGATDPNAFQTSGGFQIDSFLQRSGGAGLDDGLFSSVSFSASSDAYNFQSFAFTAAGGAVFVAQAVPEPASWGLLLLGIGLLLGRRMQAAERSHLCG